MSMSAADGQATDRIARGESVPGGPGACAKCGHGKVWHAHTDRNHPCEQCQCRGFVVPVAGLAAGRDWATFTPADFDTDAPQIQGALFGADEARGQLTF